LVIFLNNSSHQKISKKALLEKVGPVYLKSPTLQGNCKPIGLNNAELFKPIGLFIYY